MIFVLGHLQGRHRDRHERFRLRGGQPGPPGGGGGGEPEGGKLESNDDRKAQIERGRNNMMQCLLTKKILILNCQVDRTKLAGDYCDEGKHFEAEHNLPYTKRNCKLIQRLTDVGRINCSLLRTSKISTEGTWRACHFCTTMRVHDR